MVARRARPALIAVLALASAACARRDRARGADGTAPQATPRRAERAGPPPPHPFAGAWELASDPPPRGTPGLRLTLAVDSAGPDILSGRVAFMSSGDVVLDPAMFRPFTGDLGPDGAVTLAVEPARAGAPRLVLAGRLAGDTIRLRTFAIGRDTVTRGEARWYLVRRE